MKLSTVSITVALGIAGAAPAATLEERTSSVQGFDISNYQPTVNFSEAYIGGVRFVIIRATEGIFPPYPPDPTFSSHYTGATSAGLIRGGYHYAHPDLSSGSTQATFFLANGGGWTGDGITLPGMLDLEGDCYGLGPPAMVTWVQDFVNTYHSKTGRYPMIYTRNNWWNKCTGNSATFSTTCPLVLADWNGSPGTIPGGWPFYTIWQNTNTSKYGGDSDFFNGNLTQLQKLATG